MKNSLVLAICGEDVTPTKTGGVLVYKSRLGLDVVVDHSDYVKLTEFRWSIRLRPGTPWTPYIQGSNTVFRRKFPPIPMHRFLMGSPKGLFVHHKNHNGLDNRRENLLVVTPKVNSFARRLDAHKRPIKGAYKYANRNRWYAAISINNRPKNLGSFDTAFDAGEAYDRAALKHYGPMAVLNSDLRGDAR